MRAPALRSVEEMGLAEVEVLRLILRGASVVDWRRLHFAARDDVERFLRLNLFDPDDPDDRARLQSILDQAVAYLRHTFRYRVDERIAHPEEIHDVFLFASGEKEPRRLRRIACVVLKVMHVVHHLEGRERRFRVRLSDAELARRVDARIMDAARDMIGAGLPIVEFSGNLKSRESMVTKLLAKRETLAAAIYDRVRYRIVVRRRDDVLPVLTYLTETLFPFNSLMPGQTQNSLVSLRELVDRTPHLARLSSQLQHPHLVADDGKAMNEFSGESYRVLNFVVDLPVRIDAVAVGDGEGSESGTVFALVELQMVDEETSATNESGDNSHLRYKRRQLRRVLQRLSRGLVVPKPKAPEPDAPPDDDEPN